MIFVLKVLPAIALALAASAPAKHAVRAPSAPSAQLRALAEKSVKRSAWPSLRSYAKSARDADERGFSWFVLGYREYEANDFRDAQADLGESARTRFLIQDDAELYEAHAAEQAGDFARAADVLQGFAERYPKSPLRLDALEVFASASMSAGRPAAVIQALAGESSATSRSSLEESLAQAYRQTGKLREAAVAFERVYYHFPSAPESGEADEALRQLTVQLGSKFPFPTPETQTARVEILFNTGHYPEALKEYQALLKSNPSSSSGPAWTLGQARCLLRLRRYGDVVEVLSGSPWADADADAHRLALLCAAQSRLEDQPALLAALDDLYRRHPQSSSYAEALRSTASFFIRQIDWDAAAKYDQALVEEFPQSQLARDAGWHTAWADYLGGRSVSAAQKMTAHLRRYPQSPHAPAALYWLGRMAQAKGATIEARSLFALLERRYVNSYYAFEAQKQMKTAPRSAGTARVSGTVEFARLIPPAMPPTAAVCAAPASDEVRSAGWLAALSLPELAVEYLKSTLSVHPGDPEVLLALGRSETSRKNYAEALFSTREAVPSYADYTFARLPREIWDQLYPRAYWSLVRRYARADRLDPYLVMGLIRQESAFNARATSVANARGLMQMRPGTARAELRTPRRRRGRSSSRAVSRELYSPAYNIRMSCRFLRDMLKEFGGNMEETLAAYNAGDNRVNEWLSHRQFSDPVAFVESIPFTDTRVYVESVLRDAVIYRRLIGGSPTFARCGLSRGKVAGTPARAPSE